MAKKPLIVSEPIVLRPPLRKRKYVLLAEATVTKGKN